MIHSFKELVLVAEALIHKVSPEAAATTGRPQYMASRGTMPKCSLEGVYKRPWLRCSSSSFAWSEGERRKRTDSSSNPSEEARSSSSW